MAPELGTCDRERCLQQHGAEVGPFPSAWLCTVLQEGQVNVSWLTLRRSGNGWSIGPTGLDLYDGVAGIALFLAHYGRLTGDQLALELAARGASSVLSGLGAGAVRSLGGFEGWGGALYALSSMSTLLQDPSILQRLDDLVRGTEFDVESDVAYDIIGGATGLIAGLLARHGIEPSDEAVRLAVRCGEHLVRSATRQAVGAGWVNRRIGTTPLTGFAHGAAGASWALSRLSAVTGLESFGAATQDALAFERSVFAPTASNWPDLRDSARASDGKTRFSVSWCHGAPGVGIARLGMRMSGDLDPVLDTEIRAAVAATVRAGLHGNHSLCHGALGNAEFLRLAAMHLSDPALAQRCEDAATVVARMALAGRVRTGVSREVGVPGLMTGLAGIGLALLRHAEPLAVPCVLTLEPPRPRA
ncbi:type 2 lantipeptide synthetase LanM [Jiangella aurantiaca]|uniref:Type 2 lantipeptide synthetase LanM n=1 Tax=Jiangella aurantiaca TaxID=2530373 RepID=A0A4R5AH87_9ACTN|nr:type 2 lantipeptide synthetase LanM [Jiangella aurantiaca]